MKEIELIDKRRAREKHFLQEDGTVIARIYNDDIHYINKGKYKDINNTLIEKEDYIYNKANSYKAKFNKLNNNEIMNFEIDNHYIKFYLDNSQKNIKITKNKKIKNTIKYNDILKDIDIDYEINNSKIKESIILKKNKKINKIVFNIETDLRLKLKENSKIVALYNEEEKFIIDAPFMIDDNKIRNDNIKYTLKNYINNYELELVLDDKWLNDKDRKYPVVIDPTIIVNSNNKVYDTYIFPGDTNIDRYNQDILKVGVERVNNVDKINRTLLKFDLPEIGTGSQVISAKMNLFSYPGLFNSAINLYNYSYITVHQINTDWNEQTANWDTMNDKYESRIINWISGVRSYFNESIYPRACDITEIVKKWYTDVPNYGLLLKDLHEEYDNELVPAFFSKNNLIVDNSPIPYLEITYKNFNGLENYMEYASSEFNGGNQFLNLYNGNLVNAFNLLHTNSKKLPIALKLFYNTNDVVLNNNYGFGKGYRLSLNQSIKEITENNEILFLEYCDEDGTLHYFNKKRDYFDEETGDYIETTSETEYTDEDGLNKIIVKSGNDYILKDSENNSMVFINNGDRWILSKIKDATINEINITYTNNKITKVIDTDNYEINITYGSNMILFETNDDWVKLYYNNSKLSKYENKYGEILFTYDNNDCVTSIIDMCLQKYEYEYYDFIPFRMKKIRGYGLNDTPGLFFEFSYGFNLTSVVDSLNRTSTYVFKNNGTVSSISDLKIQEELDDAYAMKIDYGELGQYKNKMISRQSAFKYSTNLIDDSSFENGTIRFSNSDNITVSISENYARTGKKSLEIYNLCLSETDTKLYVKRGKYYTFSAYFLNDFHFFMEMSCDNVTGENTEDRVVIRPNMEFNRYSMTVFFPEDDIEEYGYLNIKIKADASQPVYIDDMQLEEGMVPNHYNFLENSDFSNGLSNWDVSAQYIDNGLFVEEDAVREVVTLSNGKKALKINMRPDYDSYFDYEFNHNGKQGDVFTISFWYKNGGVNSNSNDIFDVSNNKIFINFLYLEDNEGTCVYASDDLNPNENEWQFFSEQFVALADYEKVILHGMQNGNANSLLITNLCLYKDISDEACDYNVNGNLKKIVGLDNETLNINYDGNSQPVEMFDKDGDYTYIEYDNNYIGRMLRGISDKGYSNNYIYDNDGKVLYNKMECTDVPNNIIDGLYKIRLKGTNKYLKLVNNKLIIGDNDINGDYWNIEKIDEYYKISHSIVNNKFLTVNNNQVTLSEYILDKSLFELEHNQNYSYTLKNKDSNKYLKFNNNIELCENNENTYEFEIYLVKDNELVDETDYDYDENDNIKSVTDTCLNKVIYNIDPITNLTTSIIYPNGNIIEYEYNNRNQLIKKIENNKETFYSYNNSNLLTEISYDGRVYSFIYDDFSNLKHVKINNSIINTNIYDSLTQNLLTTIFGANDQINYEYDEFDRMIKMTTMNNEFKFIYGGNGELLKLISNDEVKKYSYDSANRLKEYFIDEYLIRYNYDSLIDKKELLRSKEMLIYETIYNNEKYITESTFNYFDQLASPNFPISVKYEYDILGRVTKRTLNDTYNTFYEFIKNGNRTSSIVKSVTTGNNAYSYKYDKEYNLTHIYLNNKLTNEYHYGNNNELILEYDYSNLKIIKYKYDSNGNILNKKVLNLNDNSLIENIKYGYDNDTIKDELTNYNGVNITYDSVGNPTYIGSRELKWRNGGELYEINDGNNTYKYNYNHFGVRTSKKINNVSTKFYLEGNTILFEENDNYGCNLFYLYDEVSNLIGFIYNNANIAKTYYYEKNGFLDVVGLLDENYNRVCTYEYDSWGKILSIKDECGNDISNISNHIANINPFRYRCYYYDVETKYYVLGKRYYDPEIGRFISSDLTLNSDTYGNNLYAYCGNNPTSRTDIDGEFWVLATKAIIGGACGFIGNTISNVINDRPILEGAIGATAGGIVGGLIGYYKVAPTIISLASSTVTNVINEVIDYTKSGENKNVTKANIVESSLSVLCNTTIDTILDNNISNLTDKIIKPLRGRNATTLKGLIQGKKAANDRVKDILGLSISAATETVKKGSENVFRATSKVAVATPKVTKIIGKEIVKGTKIVYNKIKNLFKRK